MQAEDVRDYPGIFISFEGGEGAGKSTHLRFLAKALEEHGQSVLQLREPGGTAIGEALREVVLDPAYAQMSDRAELLIYEAARAQIVAECILPALREGKVVLCDRFTDSTLAYQVFGRGLDRSFVEVANAFAMQGVQPQRTVLMLTGGTAATGLQRATKHTAADRLELEGDAFHTRVNDGFLQLAREFPERIRRVVSNETKSATAREVFAALADLFPWMRGVLDDRAFFAELDKPKSQV